MKRTDPPIIVEQTFKTTLNQVWEAITKVDLMQQWFFDNIDSFDPKVGFSTHFDVQVQDRKFTHLWKITEVIPGHQITYNWKYKEYAGDSFVTFELIDEKSLVKLRLITEVIENFPEDIPEFSRESCIDGWNYFIKNRLKEFLEEKNDN